MVASPSQFGPLRGLLYAEAQALLVTLWDANGESTAMFMKCFYEGIGLDRQQGRCPATRDAQPVGRLPSPPPWAPFVLIGKFS